MRACAKLTRACAKLKLWCGNPVTYWAQDRHPGRFSGQDRTAQRKRRRRIRGKSRARSVPSVHIGKISLFWAMIFVPTTVPNAQGSRVNPSYLFPSGQGEERNMGQDHREHRFGFLFSFFYLSTLLPYHTKIYRVLQEYNPNVKHTVYTLDRILVWTLFFCIVVWDIRGKGNNALTQKQHP